MDDDFSAHSGQVTNKHIFFNQKSFKSMCTFIVNIVTALNLNLYFDSVGRILLSEALSSLK